MLRPLRSLGLAAALAATALCARVPAAAAQEGTEDADRGVSSHGPLMFEEGGPLQRISYTPAVEGADLVPAGRTWGTVWFGYSNVFEQDSAATHDLFLDFERFATTFTLAYGLSDRVEVGGRVAFETTGGGLLDGFISGWHEKLGLQNANRDRYPSDQYAQRLRDGTGEVRLDVPQHTLALTDLRLFAKWRVWESRDGRRLVSLRGIARIPTQDLRVGSQSTDVALMALARLSWTKWHIHALASGSTVRASGSYDGLLRSSAWSMTLSGERALAPTVSAITQFSLATPRLRGIADSEVDGWVGNLVFGLAGTVGDDWRWEASFQEDIPPNSPAVDFTLGLGLRRTW